MSEEECVEGHKEIFNDTLKISVVWKNNEDYRAMYDNNFIYFYEDYYNYTWQCWDDGVKPYLTLNPTSTDFIFPKPVITMSEDDKRLKRKKEFYLKGLSLMTKEEKEQLRLKYDEFNKQWKKQMETIAKMSNKQFKEYLLFRHY